MTEWGRFAAGTMTGGTATEDNGSFVAVRNDGCTKRVADLREAVHFLLRREPWWRRRLGRRRSWWQKESR